MGEEEEEAEVEHQVLAAEGGQVLVDTAQEVGRDTCMDHKAEAAVAWDGHHHNSCWCPCPLDGW